MNRIAVAITLALFASPASAQPKKAPPKAPKKAPVDPYTDPKPSDPYAAPAPVGPALPPGSKPAAPTKPADPKGKPGKPANPYADPKPVKAKPSDPYAAPAPTTTPSIPARVGLGDLTAVQGLLAVQRLDGWLLFDRDGANPIAKRLVAPDGNPSRPWFYLIPARGEPIALVHDAEKRSFEHLGGTKLTYQGRGELDKQLKIVLKGKKIVAAEYSPKAGVPNVSRVDAGTMEMIRAAGVTVKSSHTLVQYTKAIWGDAGRTAHYLAVHHLVELRKEALAFVVKQLQSNAALTEYDVQQRIVRGMTMRGLAGAPPVVAAGVNTADPYYVPSASKNAPIRRGDLIVISLAAKADKPEGIYAAHTWVAAADTTVRPDVAKAFETVSLARDQALAVVGDRARKGRPLTGAEVDQATRAFIKKAGFAANVKHRTGHSIDNDLQGGGSDLDDFEVRDTRILLAGTGFTVGPGLYFASQFGVRTEVSVFLGPNGPEVTTPAQDDIEVLFGR
jgi:Xaa-Pro dipeptidase